MRTSRVGTALARTPREGVLVGKGRGIFLSVGEHALVGRSRVIIFVVLIVLRVDGFISSVLDAVRREVGEARVPDLGLFVLK